MESKSTIAVVGSFENQLDFVRNLVEGTVVRSIVRDTRDCSPKFISWDVILNEKVGESYTEISTKPFVAKIIHAKVVQVVAELFAHNRYQADCTLEAMDREEFYKILKPKDYSYSLERVANQISLEELKEALVQPLKEIEKMEASFEQRVIEQRKFVKKQLGWQSPAVLKEMVFDTVWSELEPEVTAKYYAWLDGIGKTLYGYLSSLVGHEMVGRSTTEKAGVLPELLDVSQPFNLIVESFTITCRPREGEVKGHFRLVPTEGKSFMQDFDFSLNNADKVLLLVDAKKQGSKLISEIAKRLKWQKWSVPVCVMFTEARNAIANYVHKRADDFTAVRQEDYDKQIGNAIEEVERAVTEQSRTLPVTTKVVWNSLRFFSEQIDPVLKAVKKQAPDKLEHFNPEGFYKEVQELTQDDTQSRIEELVLNKDAIDGIVEALTTNKVIVNQYSNRAGFRCAKSQDVIGYYESLQRGQGYTCDSFSINMRGLISRVLRDAIPVHSEELARTINMIAFKLSYSNPIIRDTIDSCYNKPASYVDTLLNIQQKFREVFGSSEFRDILVEENIL